MGIREVLSWRLIDLVNRHGIANVLAGISDPAAVEANELRIFCQLFYLVE